MLEVAIMIEGQDGLDWPRWKRLVRTVEDSEYAGLFRSDHFPNIRTGSYRDGLELWSSLVWLAENTEMIKFEPLVPLLSASRHIVPLRRFYTTLRQPGQARWVSSGGYGQRLRTFSASSRSSRSSEQ